MPRADAKSACRCRSSQRLGRRPGSWITGSGTAPSGGAEREAGWTAHVWIQAADLRPGGDSKQSFTDSKACPCDESHAHPAVVERVCAVLLPAGPVKVGVQAAGHYYRPLLGSGVWPAGWEVVELSPALVSEL
jgi:hypothetical protein